MSFGEEQNIHISNACKDLLPKSYETKERGTIVVKGKGEMTTFWCLEKAGRVPPTKEEVMPAGL